MLRQLAAAAAVFAWAAQAHAAPQSAPAGASPMSPPDSDVSLTIYNSNLALVQDHRVVDLPAGRSRLELKDVSASIRPETVSLTGPGMSVVEQNFDYDLLTPEKMMEKAVGRQVQIVRVNPGNGAETTETATVLSANGGVVLKVNGRIEVLRADGVPTRVIFDKVPETLRAQPTLSVMVQAARAGPTPVDLSYLTTGLSWKADYVALFDEARGALDFQGWITLNNTSGTGFANAKTLLVAGDVSISGDEQPWQANQFNRFNRFRPNVRTAGNEASNTPSVGDLYLYPLAERTTVADKQTKQVGFIDAKQVRARKVYQYRAGGFESQQQPQHVDSVLEFANSSGGGLGHPLPAGVVRVYQRDAMGQAQFVGEDSIDHTPQGSELSLKTGEAFDITVQASLDSTDGSSERIHRYAMSYHVHNAKPSPVVVEIRQDGFWPNGRVVKESLKGRKLDASTYAWDVPVPAQGDTTLTFTAQTVD